MEAQDGHTGTAAMGDTSSCLALASHLELQDEFSLLEGAPVDRHPLIGDTLQVSRSDNIT